MQNMPSNLTMHWSNYRSRSLACRLLEDRMVGLSNMAMVRCPVILVVLPMFIQSRRQTESHLGADRDSGNSSPSISGFSLESPFRDVRYMART